MKNIVITLCLMIFTLKASEHPPFSSPDLRNSTHTQNQEIPTNNSRARLSLSDRMRQLNPSLNLDVNQLLASANVNPSATNQSPK